MAGQQFEYGFDDIGNRKNTKTGGDENGWNLRPANYAANNLNQYTSRDVPGYVDIMGTSYATNSVTVNSQTAYRKGEYFRKELAVGNGSAPLWTNIIVAATGQTSVTGNVFVAKAAEAFTYDADGNLTSDGRWTNRWDAENRLVAMETLNAVPTGGKKALGFSYDARSRRQSLVVSNWSGSAWTNVTAQTRRFIYDDWNLLAALDGNNARVQSFVWGIDLSGSLQGAGGVGGLLAVNDAANGVHFAAYDGNGNVMALVKGSDGTVSANYEYGPFGETVRATGPMAKANVMRFSTKYQDADTDFLYYGYRSYNPTLGKWLSRDPIGEFGGIGMCAFVNNDAVNKVDLRGLITARAAVELTVSEIFKRYLGYETVITTGYLPAMARYRSLLPRIKIELGILKLHALYYPSDDRLVVDTRGGAVLAFNTISHELVHVYNDLIMGLGANRYEEVDEGMGYAMGGLASVVRELQGLEGVIRTSTCEEIEGYGYKWKNFWRTWGIVPSRSWGDVEWDDGEKKRPLAINDLQNLQRIHGVALSCNQVAAALNSIVWSKGCCLTFTCNPYDDDGGRVGTGIQINEFFE